MRIIGLCCIILWVHDISISQNVGIDNTNPTQKLDVNGKIKIGDDAAAPQAGTIRWNVVSKDFEGFDGTNWISFSRKNWGNDVKVRAADERPWSYFGNAVSMSGDYAVIGCRYDFIGSHERQGSAYIFKKTGGLWIQQAKLVASDGAQDDQFGWSVSIDGDYVVIGSRFGDVGTNQNQGAAYVFIRNGESWTEQAKLTASNGLAGDEFGTSVAISGDYVIVGVPLHNGARGSAYIYSRSGTTWTQQATYTASDVSPGDFFGASVSMDGEYAVIGAQFDDIGSSENQGSAYIFKRNNTIWEQQAKLVALDGSGGDEFGNSVCIDKEYVIVGAFIDDISSENQGSAYIFFRNNTTWTQQAKLSASDGNAWDFFGCSVSIDGIYAIAGARMDDIDTYNDQGSAYLFVRNGTTWSQQNKFVSSSNNGSIEFGSAVSISGNAVMAGAPYEDNENIINSGSVFFFSKD